MSTTESTSTTKYAIYGTVAGRYLAGENRWGTPHWRDLDDPEVWLFDNQSRALAAIADEAQARRVTDRCLEVHAVTVTTEPGGRVAGEPWAEGEQYAVRVSDGSFLPSDPSANFGAYRLADAALFPTRAAAMSAICADARRSVGYSGPWAYGTTIVPVTTTAPRETRTASAPL
jgi:hypothetical protein